MSASRIEHDLLGDAEVPAEAFCFRVIGSDFPVSRSAELLAPAAMSGQGRPT